MDFIKETVLEKLAQHGYPLKPKGLDPEAGEPSQELKDFSKTVYSSEYASPRLEEKFRKSITEGHTTYTMLSGVECAYGGTWPCYLYKIEQYGPTQKDYYWHSWQSCTWESRYLWPEKGKNWEQEETINIGKQSLRVAGQEYVPSCVPGLSRPKYPSEYDDRVKIKYPYSRRNLRDRLGGTSYDFAFLWDLMVNRGSSFAMKVLKAQQLASLQNKEPEWEDLKKEVKTLIQQGEKGKNNAQNLIKNYLANRRQHS